MRNHTKYFFVLFSVLVASLFLTQAARSRQDFSTPSLTPVIQNGEQLVFDANNQVYWLADANFAASADGQKIQAAMGLNGIASNGMMD